ncbi:MAG TPA: hypothetical protein VLJ13_03215 [Brevundimonas sp.]|nr:hypothetical protein [Brevundimonas sp.]
MTLYSQIGMALTVLVVAFAFLKGDEPERMGAAALVLVFLAGIVIPGSTGFIVSQWGLMGLDVLLLAVLVGLMWHTRRAWLMWATAFQGLIVTGHALVAADLRPDGDAFSAVNNLSNYGLLVAMAVGTFWAWQERRAAGLE